MKFIAYRRAERALLDKVFRARIKSDPALANIEIVTTEHDGPIRSVGGENPFDAVPETGISEMTLSVEAIEALDVDAYAATIVSAADQTISTVGKMIFRNVGAIAKHVGNDLDGRGLTLFQQFKQGILRVELSFREDGQVELPDLFVTPGQETAARITMDEVLRDPEVIASIEARRDAFLKSRSKRRLWPC